MNSENSGSQPSQRKGSCLCQKSSVSIRSSKRSMGACHCPMCKTWGGGPLLTIDVPADEVEIGGTEYIQVFDSSDWAERAFCRSCGTHLYYRLKQQNHFSIPVGLLQPTDDLNFDHQIFIDEKSPCYSFANETHNMTRKEVFAKYAPKD